MGLNAIIPLEGHAGYIKLVSKHHLAVRDAIIFDVKSVVSFIVREFGAHALVNGPWRFLPKLERPHGVVESVKPRIGRANVSCCNGLDLVIPISSIIGHKPPDMNAYLTR